MTPRILSIAAPSGSGKTTLIERLLPRLRAHGLRVGALKSDAHRVELDTPGKDTHRMREAGAEVTALVSRAQIGVFLAEAEAPPLGDIVRCFFASVDLVLAEGFRSQGYPTLVIERKGVDAGGWRWPDSVIAIATDENANNNNANHETAKNEAANNETANDRSGSQRPTRLPLDDPDAIVAFLTAQLGLPARSPRGADRDD